MMTKESTIGDIVAVCTNPADGIPKYPQSQVYVDTLGLVGDYHNREMRRSFSKPGTSKPNTDRHITIVAEEVLEALNQELGTKLVPGSFGENILVRGMGDLSQIPDGSLLRVHRTGIVFRVMEQNQPCKNLAPYHRLMVKKAHGRRGLLCAVQEGVGEYIRPGNLLRWTDVP